jgi:hypothetical protein
MDAVLSPVFHVPPLFPLNVMVLLGQMLVVAAGDNVDVTTPVPAGLTSKVRAGEMVVPQSFVISQTQVPASDSAIWFKLSNEVVCEGTAVPFCFHTKVAALSQ